MSMHLPRAECGQRVEAGHSLMTEPERYLTIEEVTRLTRWTKATAFKRASLDSWGKLGTRPQKYRMSDVLASAKTTPDTRIRSHLLAKASLTRVK